MASPQSPNDSGNLGTPKESEELTREKLIQKYKTLMALTNKIKIARNEALSENESLKNEIETANEKIKILSQQNVTAEEMLAALTDQKLKMAMEIDDMKKEKQNYYKTVKENASRETESYQLENERLKKENNDLLLKLNEKEQNELQLQNDVKKLNENNENVIILCNNIRKEKIELQSKLEEIESTLNKVQDEKKGVLELLSNQFNRHFENINCLKQFLEQELKSFCNYQCAEEMNILLDKNLSLKNNVAELNDSISTFLKERESSKTNIFNLTNKMEKLKSELEIVTSDRDQIMNNLESVRLETKHLIENSEKLVDELEILKVEKIKNEHEMNTLLNNKNDEIEHVRNQLLDLQQFSEELKANLLSYSEYVAALERKQCDCFKENLQYSLTDKSVIIRESKKREATNEFTNEFLTKIDNLSKIRNTFSTITESVQNIDIKLLQNEVHASELELIKVINKLDSIITNEENYKCPNIKCSCFWLKNIGTKLNENMTYYEKILTDMKHDIEFLQEHSTIISNKDKFNEKVKEEFNLNIIRNKKKHPGYQISQGVQMENILSKVEEYEVLNDLLEKKITICREELGFALVQLHNAEELGELMQHEIQSLQSHLYDAIAERERLNDMVNEKVKVIIKLDEELSAEQSKAHKLISDLENSQIELNAAKNALDVEQTKSTQLYNYLENSQCERNATKIALDAKKTKSTKLFSEMKFSQTHLPAAKQELNLGQSISTQSMNNIENELALTKQVLDAELLKSQKLISDLQSSQIEFNETKYALDAEKTKSKKLIGDLERYQSELNIVKYALDTEQSKTNQLIDELKNAHLEINVAKHALQIEQLKSNKLLDDLSDSQSNLSEVQQALDVELSNSSRLINDKKKIQSELNTNKQTLDVEQSKSHKLINDIEQSHCELNAAKDALLAEQTKFNLLKKDLEKSQCELNGTRQALFIEESKSNKLITELENSRVELNEVKNLLEDKYKSIKDLKKESTNAISKISELAEANLKLKQENDSLKLNISETVKQIETTKLRETQDKNEILGLKLSEEQLNTELVKLEETKKKLKIKLPSYKMNVDDLRKEILTLKEYCKNLHEDQYCSLQKTHQEIVKSMNEQVAVWLAQENLLKENLCDLRIEKEGLFRSEPKKNMLSQEIISKDKNADIECQRPGKKHLVENACQVNMQQNENNAILIQEVRKDSDSQNNSSNSRKEEISKSGELELLSEHNSAKIQSLETSLALSKQELATTQLEINQLREEFYSYRLRAQALLSKQKGELESQREKEAKEQIEKLNNELESIRSKMEIILTEDESLKYRLSTLQSEKEITDKKYDDISRALHQKIIDHDALNTEYNAFKLSTDTLIHNGKILLEEKYKSEITAKDAIINKLKSELKEKHTSYADDKISEVSQYTPSVHNMEEILQEREDGEGSETTPTPFPERHEFVPLDVLINNPVEDEESQVTILQEQVNMLTAELSSHDIRSKHLSSLLREAEKESARNSQQNAVLKEEVRRLERCLERQPLVANTEYLKNVVFKFFTLQSADERTRLVPVLDSVLKLSPAEAQKLNEIARGEGGSSWSNYLHSWTGLG